MIASELSRPTLEILLKDVRLSRFHGTGKTAALICGALLLFSAGAALAQATPPSAPQNLELSREAGGVRLTWAAPANPGSGVIAYVITWDEDPDADPPEGIGRLEGDELPGESGDLSFLIEGLTLFTEYRVTVAAVAGSLSAPRDARAGESAPIDYVFRPRDIRDVAAGLDSTLTLTLVASPSPALRGDIVTLTVMLDRTLSESVDVPVTGVDLRASRSSFSVLVVVNEGQNSGSMIFTPDTSAPTPRVLLLIPPTGDRLDADVLSLNIGTPEPEPEPEPEPPSPVTPVIVITPPLNGDTVVVTVAEGALTRVSPGNVICRGGSQCRLPQPYFAADCSVSPGAMLPQTCTSAPVGGDRRLELPALHSGIVWVVTDDSNVVLASAEQAFYVAPTIGFDTRSKVRPATGANPIRVGLSISPLPVGASLGNGVMVRTTMNGTAVGSVVTLSHTATSEVVPFQSLAVGTLELEIVEPDQRNTIANYERLTPETPADAANYLYAVGNGEVEIADLQGDLIVSETSPRAVTASSGAVTASLTINDVVVTEGGITYTLMGDENAEAGILGNPDVSSTETVSDSGDLTVVFGPRPSDGDIIQLTLTLSSGGESSPMRTIRLLLPFFTATVDMNNNNVPDSMQDFTAVTGLQVRDAAGAQSSPVQVTDGLMLALGAHAVNAAARMTPPVYSAAFSPSDVEAVVLPPPPAYSGTGIFDFRVTGLDNPGDVATVLIPLLGAARDGALLRKYAPDNNDGVYRWAPFTTGAQVPDEIWSAPRTATGACPLLSASRGDGEGYVWRSAAGGVRAGDECLLLQIQDGGLNDADGLVNGVIYDPNALSDRISRGGGGGGVIEWGWLWVLAMGLLAATGGRRREKRLA